MKGLEQQPGKSTFFENALLSELLRRKKIHTFGCNNEINPINNLPNKNFILLM